MSYIVHHGAVPAGLQVLHRCDNPPCVNPHHLWIGTTADNMRDKADKGRCGDRPQRKLSKVQVQAIRDSPWGGKRLGKLLGVHPEVIRNAKHRRSYQWVPNQNPAAWWGLRKVIP